MNNMLHIFAEKCGELLLSLFKNTKMNMKKTQIYHTGRGKFFNVDQLYLWKYIWPRIINTHIAHIKNIPSLRFTGNEKLFPVENKDKSFVGEPILRRTY